MLGLYRKETVVSAQIRLISPVPKHCALQCHPCWPRKAKFGTVVNKKHNKSGRALSTCTQKLDRPSLAFVQQCRKMLGTRESAVTRRLQTFTGASFMSEWNSGFTVAGFPGSYSLPMSTLLCFQDSPRNIFPPQKACSSTNLLCCDSNITRNCVAYLIGMCSRACY